MAFENGQCFHCGSRKRRPTAEQAVKKSVRQPRSLAAIVRERLRQPVQVKEGSANLKARRFERVVSRVWYEINSKYRIEQSAEGKTIYVRRSDD